MFGFEGAPTDLIPGLAVTSCPFSSSKTHNGFKIKVLKQIWHVPTKSRKKRMRLTFISALKFKNILVISNVEKGVREPFSSERGRRSKKVLFCVLFSSCLFTQTDEGERRRIAAIVRRGKRHARGLLHISRDRILRGKWSVWAAAFLGWEFPSLSSALQEKKRVCVPPFHGRTETAEPVRESVRILCMNLVLR
ncbi:hypothetical protein AVEN_200542-1 [Araneus ventricosus]|uniref:Uncharacterized protein n=1 Tax=Araneus ventricosus TaxID=182803 RepID=A0A4Y2U346_ARAVE|nr:hypothetical protein AVEN_200542-1 [Araneus ventricosus]